MAKAPASDARPASDAQKAPRRRRSAAEARRVILDAAEKRLVEGGPEAVRLQDVAGDLGLSHPAILHHFGSREGLLLALESRAMDRLRDDLLGALDASTGDLLDRVANVLGNQGYARVLAWAVRRGLAQDGGDDTMLRDLADAYHAARLAAAPPGEVPDYEDTVFGVRLSAVALFGEALIGPLLTRSAGLEDDAEVRPRFRRWLADLLSDGVDGGR